MNKDYVRARISIMEFMDISSKELRQKLNLIDNMMINGADQITTTIERSSTQCGRFNLIIYVSAEHRLDALDIARLYKYLSAGILPKELMIMIRDDE